MILVVRDDYDNTCTIIDRNQEQKNLEGVLLRFKAQKEKEGFKTILNSWVLTYYKTGECYSILPCFKRNIPLKVTTFRW